MFAKLKWLPIQSLLIRPAKKFDQIQEEREILDDIETNIFQTIPVSDIPLYKLIHCDDLLLILQQLAHSRIQELTGIYLGASLSPQVNEPGSSFNVGEPPKLRRSFSIKRFLSAKRNAKIISQAYASQNNSENRPAPPDIVDIWTLTFSDSVRGYGCQTPTLHHVPALLDQLCSFIEVHITDFTQLYRTMTSPLCHSHRIEVLELAFGISPPQSSFFAEKAKQFHFHGITVEEAMMLLADWFSSSPKPLITFQSNDQMTAKNLFMAIHQFFEHHFKGRCMLSPSHLKFMDLKTMGMLTSSTMKRNGSTDQFDSLDSTQTRLYIEERENEKVRDRFQDDATGTLNTNILCTMRAYELISLRDHSIAELRLHLFPTRPVHQLVDLLRHSVILLERDHARILSYLMDWIHALANKWCPLDHLYQYSGQSQRFQMYRVFLQRFIPILVSPEDANSSWLVTWLTLLLIHWPAVRVASPCQLNIVTSPGGLPSY